jgi:hypothetical protein
MFRFTDTDTISVFTGITGIRLDDRDTAVNIWVESTPPARTLRLFVVRLSRYEPNLVRLIKHLCISSTVYILSGRPSDSCRSIAVPRSISYIHVHDFNRVVHLDLSRTVITQLQPWAFKDSHVQKIDLPTGLRIIPEFCFAFSALRSIEFPESTCVIDEGAFQGCKSLTRLALPTALLVIPLHMCAGCDSLVTVVIPDGVLEIESLAFSECSALVNVVIPDSVETISSTAFSACLFMEDTSRDEFLRLYGDHWPGFVDLSQCTVKVLPTMALSSWEDVRKISLPPRVQVISDQCLSHTAITSLDVPESVRVIGVSAFYDCELLEVLTLPDGLTVISRNMCAHCYALKTIEIPDGVLNIGAGAFQECRSLTRVVIPDSVEDVGNKAFSGCERLATIDIGNGVRYIGSCAFRRCGVTSVHLPGSLSVLGENAFAGCAALVRVTHGASVVPMLRMLERAFASCPNLTDFESDGVIRMFPDVFLHNLNPPAVKNQSVEYRAKRRRTGP